jgi:hypothetical protein
MIRKGSKADDLLRSTPILQKALKTRERGAIHPRELLRRVGVIFSAFLVGLLGLVVTLLLIRWRVFDGSQQQAFAALSVLLSGTLMIVSVVGAFLTLWNAFVSTYLELRGSQLETAEVTGSIQTLVGSLVEAAPDVELTSERIEEIAPSGTYVVNEPLVQAVKAVARAAPAETAEMVTAFAEAATATAGVIIRVRSG